MKIGPKWVHMAWYELILKLDGALWLILKLQLTPKGAIKHLPKQNKILKSVPNLPWHIAIFTLRPRWQSAQNDISHLVLTLLSELCWNHNGWFNALLRSCCIL